MKSRLNYRILIVCSLLLTAALACAFDGPAPMEATPVPADTPLPTLTSTPLPVPTSTPGPFTAIFSDDFSDPESGWLVESTDSYSLEYINGEYVIKRPQTGSIWAAPGGSGGIPTNLYQSSVEFTVKSFQQSSEPYFGAYCGFEDNENYYALLAHPGGLYRIMKQVAGEFTTLSPDDGGGWAKSEKIAQWAPTYKFRAECGWEGLVLYVDGIKIDQIEDAPSIGGRVALRVGFFKDNGEIHIDDFSVGTIIG